MIPAPEFNERLRAIVDRMAAALMTATTDAEFDATMKALLVEEVPNLTMTEAALCAGIGLEAAMREKMGRPWST